MHDDDFPNVFDVAFTLAASTTVIEILKGRFPNLGTSETAELANRIVLGVFKALRGEVPDASVPRT